MYVHCSVGLYTERRPITGDFGEQTCLTAMSAMYHARLPVQMERQMELSRGESSMNVLPSWDVDVMDVLNIISRLTLYALVSHL